MESSPPESPVNTLGLRLRQARLQRGFSQEALAGSDFTKGYVSALERGAVRPSLKALEVLARRLEVPISEFLAAAVTPAVEADPEAVAEDLHYQLNYANMLIHTAQIDEAFQLIQTAEEGLQACWEQVDVTVRYRIPYLRGLAYLQSGDYVQARRALETALGLLDTASHQEPVARVQNLLGVSFYQEEQPQVALPLHEQCSQVVRAGHVKDPNLRLSIYTNLANDYWALDKVKQAIATYQESLTLLEDFNDLDRQARIYWGLSMAYRVEGNWDLAKRYATQALHIYEAKANQTFAATISLNLAEILTGEQNYTEAESLLERAKTFLSSAGDPLLLSTLYQNYADLAARQGNLEAAATYAEQSVQFSASVSAQAAAAPARYQGNALRTHAQALYTAALIAEKRGDPAAADEWFQQALVAIEQTGFTESAYEITFGYAAALETRGAYPEAMKYYRAAAQYHRPAR